MTRVLIVDDKEENLYYLEALLTPEGYVVESARHGAEALVRARQTRPDVIISDLLMPVMDGYTLLRHWKNDARLKEVPFIVYTATYTEPEDERLALQLGADAFMLKPAEPDEFLARLREVEAAGSAAAASIEPEQSSDEAALLQNYSEILIRKLEQKTIQLQEANRALQDDIAARQRTETALRASEAQFASAFVHAAVGMALLTPAGHYLKVNRALCEMFGYSEAELLARTYLDITHPEDSDEPGERRRLLIGEVDTFQLEKRYLHRDGQVVWGCLNVSLVRDEAGAPFHLIAQIQNITERKKSEEATARALNRLNEAQRIGQIGDWEWSPATEEIIWSPQVFEIIGRDPLLGPPRDYDENAAAFEEASRTLMREKVTLAMESGEPQYYELVARRPNGEQVEVLGRAVARKDETGKVVGLYGTIQDITERKRSEAALKKSEQRYRELFEHMLEGYAYCRAIFDGERLVDFVYLEVNAAFGKLTGLPDVVGKKISDLIPDVYERSRAVMEVYERAILSGVPERCVTFVEVLRSWLSLTVYSSDHEHFVVVFDNITERVEAEAALREREAEFRALAEAMPQMVWVMRGDGSIVYHNEQWIDYTGQTFEESLGSGWSVALHPDERERVNMAWAETMAAPRLYSMECRIRRADGVYRWWLVRGVPQRDTAGNVAKWFGTCTDVHELKQAELKIQSLNADLETRVVQRTRELYAATQEAEKANRAKSEFLSRTSHELRTPLNAILGFGQLLEVEGRDPDEADCVDQILRAGRHLLGLINEMLDISRIEAGQLELSLQSLPLNESISEALALVRPMATDRGVTLEPFESEARIVGDRQRFKQVVLNLLSNAVKYNRRGGRVMCATTGLGGGWLRFSVADTGVGIAEADSTKVFTAFERFGAAATQVEGIGLGLAITRQLTELMGGRIGFHSVPGEGSIFWVELPVAGKAPASAEANAKAPAQIAAAEAVGSRKLLYIEDNLSNLRLVTRIVARRPAVEFLSATTGSLGLEVARAQRPHLIILDLHLPDLDGDEVLRHLQADPVTAAIPVIMLSADAVPARGEQMLAAGARAFLTKPLEVRAFLAAIDNFLG